MKFFAKKYPELSNRLKGTSVRRLKNLYQDSRKGDTPSEKDFEEFSSKKNGCPLKIGENLDKQVMEYVSHMRSTGTAVNTAVVMSCAEGILMHEDASMLSRVDLNKGWAQYLLHRMGFVKRKATTKAKVSVENFAELKSDYLLKIKNIIAMDEIPAELVINFDQTALNIVPTSDWTMEAEGNKRVEIIAKDDKRQITAVLAGTLNGDFLPCQIIYQGTTTRCLPRYDFPNNWHITYSANYWSNEETMTEYVDNVLNPYIAEKRMSLNLSKDYPALIIFDNFKAQCTSAFLTKLDHNNINVVLVPPNCTDRLQPLDVSVNKAIKISFVLSFSIGMPTKYANNIERDKKTNRLENECSKAT